MPRQARQAPPLEFAACVEKAQAERIMFKVPILTFGNSPELAKSLAQKFFSAISLCDHLDDKIDLHL